MFDLNWEVLRSQKLVHRKMKKRNSSDEVIVNSINLYNVYKWVELNLLMVDFLIKTMLLLEGINLFYAYKCHLLYLYCMLAKSKILPN